MVLWGWGAAQKERHESPCREEPMYGKQWRPGLGRKQQGEEWEQI